MSITIVPQNEVKHTPGPWEARYMSHPVAADSFIVYDANGLPVADPCNRGRTEEERIANAQLIAAAPEMLEALKAARAYLGQRETRITRNEVREMILAAIRKAEGNG